MESFIELVQRRPKVALRRVRRDRDLINAIRSYILNRGYEAGPKALEYVRQLVGRGL